MVGGSSTGDQRIRREESLPILKRRLLGGLLDFSARELQVQVVGLSSKSYSLLSVQRCFVYMCEPFFFLYFFALSTFCTSFFYLCLVLYSLVLA
jgi:hypothetical protein